MKTEKHAERTEDTPAWLFGLPDRLEAIQRDVQELAGNSRRQGDEAFAGRAHTHDKEILNFHTERLMRLVCMLGTVAGEMRTKQNEAWCAACGR